MTDPGDHHGAIGVITMGGIRNQVHVALDEQQIDRQLRMPCSERGQQRGQLGAGPGRRCGDSQHAPNGAAGIDRSCLGFGERRQGLAASFIECPAGVGEGETPGRSIDQAHSEASLESGDAAADRRLRATESTGPA